MQRKTGIEKLEPPVKIALYGSYSVGKTSLAKRWVEDVHNNTSPTIGAGFFTREKEIDGKVIKCQIWDTAGSEKFKSIVPIYLRQAEACLICFEALDPENIEKMINFVNEIKPELRIILVKTKCDISNSIDIDQEEFRRYIYEKGYPYYETSSKTGNGVDKVFVDAFRLCMKKDSQEDDFDQVDLDDEDDDLSPKGGCCIIL